MRGQLPDCATFRTACNTSARREKDIGNSRDHPSRLSEEAVFVIFDVINKRGTPKEAREMIKTKLYLRRPHRKTVTGVFNVGVEFFRRDPSALNVLTTQEVDEIAGEAAYGVSPSRVVQLHRLYQLWARHRSERTKEDVVDVATKRFEEEIRAHVETKQRVHVEPKEFLPLLHRWREQAQLWSPDQFLRHFYLRGLGEKLLQHGISAEDMEIYDAAKRHHAQTSQPYDATKRHHAQTSQLWERVLLQVEQEGLFRRLRQCYPADAIWEAQDSWGRIYAAYLEAFISWCGDIKYHLECFIALILLDELPQEDREVASAEAFLEQLKKEDANWLAFLELASLVTCCNLLTLGMAELPAHPLWFSQVDKLQVLRSDGVNLGTKLPKHCSLAQDQIGEMARFLWERLTEVKENTRDLLHKLQRLQAAHDDLHRKLTALEFRLYDVTESQPP